MNVLQTCFSRSWGGLEIQALEVTRLLKASGHDVWLACCSNSRLYDEATSQDLQAVRYDVRGYLHPVIIWQLSRFIRHTRINIIHCQLSKDIATMVPAIKLTKRKIPLVLSKRVGSYIHKKDLLHRFTYARVDLVLAISDVIRKNVLETTPMTVDKVLTLHDAIDTDHFSPARADGKQVRREFGIADDVMVIGFVGRFSPGKGHEEFLEAANILRKKQSNLRFLVVGEASYGEQPYEQKIKALSQSLGLDSVVTFTGFRRDIPNVIAAFDIFAFPSHAESFGVALIEAMAMQLPVVSTNCDGVLDIVTNGETGLLVNRRQAGELADALERLLNDRNLRERLGSAARQNVVRHFNQRTQIRRLEEIYRRLIGT